MSLHPRLLRGQKGMLYPAPNLCHQKAVLHVCAGVDRKVWLEDTMIPTYHTVMRKCVSGSRLCYGTLL